MKAFLRYLWAAPITVLGLILAVAAWGRGAHLAAKNGVLEVWGAPVARIVSRLPRVLQFEAITFGHVVFAQSGSLMDEWRAHERAHVRQYERWGVFFWPAYAIASVIAYLRGGDAYVDNYFEREAFRAARRGG